MRSLSRSLSLSLSLSLYALIGVLTQYFLSLFFSIVAYQGTDSVHILAFSFAHASLA